MERRADKQIARQEDALVRAVVRVWKAHERGRLLERVENTRLLRQAWEAWKRRLRHKKELEGLAASPFMIFCTLSYSQYPKCLDAALSFAQRCQSHVTSSALQVWHKRLAMQQGANAFAVQYANSQLQFRILYRWRVQLRVHLKRFRQAKIADKFFVVRRAWRMWVDKAEERGREKRSREWNKEKARKLFAGTSEQCLLGTLWGLRAFGPAGWKEKALRLRRHRLAEQEIRARIDEVGTQKTLAVDFLSHRSVFVLAARIEGCSRPLDKSRHRGETARTRSSATEKQGDCSVSRPSHCLV